MIAWMQKHNKYLVVTIWVATIAFIGAGFVGWGTYQYGTKASTIARVGDIEISKEKFNFTYGNLYKEYANAMKGRFDEEKARKMGLTKIVYSQLVMQSLLLNLAKEFGVVVSDEELAEYISSIPAFQDKGVFNKKIYLTYLDNQAIKAKDFELIVKDDLIVAKMLKMLNRKAEPYELKVVESALSLMDKIRYEVIRSGDVDITMDEGELRKYWEKNKSSYMTKRSCELSLLWTPTDSIDLKDGEAKEYYEKNSYNYLDKNGKMMKFEDVKKRVEYDLRIKKGKKQALLDYIAFKKGKKTPSESKVLTIGDKALPASMWDEIAKSKVGAVLKPKVIDGKYVSAKVLSVEEPRPMAFEEARSMVEKELVAKKRISEMDKKASKLLEDTSKLTKSSDYLKVDKMEVLKPLSKEETSEFLQKLFTSNKKQGIIAVSGSRVVYEIVDQKRDDSWKIRSAEIVESVNNIKKREFEQEILKDLSRRYPAQSYVKGL